MTQRYEPQELRESRKQDKQCLQECQFACADEMQTTSQLQQELVEHMHKQNHCPRDDGSYVSQIYAILQLFMIDEQ